MQASPLLYSRPLASKDARVVYSLASRAEKGLPSTSTRAVFLDIPIVFPVKTDLARIFQELPAPTADVTVLLSGLATAIVKHPG